MEATNFPEANDSFGPPPGMAEVHCRRVPVFTRVIQGSVWDGCQQVVTAWKPNEEDLKRLNEGGLVYFSSMGGLTPHFLSTSFEETIAPE
jgi:hypothetical protein